METYVSNEELTSWVEVCLQNENLTNISAKIVGHSEIGENFLSDIAFVNASGSTKNGSRKEYNLVLKCSKKNKIFRQNASVQEIFTNEFHVYGKVIPAFKKFQKERGVENVFSGTPKYYGCVFSDDQDVIAFEDLTKSGYSLWDKQKPMLREHILLVLQEYAKFHATSVAMQDQEPEVYNELTRQFDVFVEGFWKMGDNFVKNFVVAIEETHELLKNEVTKEVLSRWKCFGERVKTDFLETIKNYSGLKVINHGDSWNNNFLFKTEENFNFPLEVSIIDWQIARKDTPIADLSHFLFSCISEEDLRDFDNILEEYYKCFSEYLERLKSNPNILYPKKAFLADWKKYSNLGVAMAAVVLRLCCAEKNEAPDVTKAAEDGDFTKAFRFHMKDKTLFKTRMKPIVQFVIENDLI